MSRLYFYCFSIFELHITTSFTSFHRNRVSRTSFVVIAKLYSLTIVHIFKLTCIIVI